jgi:hypothetical protein
MFSLLWRGGVVEWYLLRLPPRRLVGREIESRLYRVVAFKKLYIVSSDNT